MRLMLSPAETHGGEPSGSETGAPAQTGRPGRNRSTSGRRCARREIRSLESRSSRRPGARPATRSPTPGATGTVGPNLDDAKPPYDLVIERVTNGAGAMPPFKGQLSDQEIKDVAAYVVQATSG